MNLILKIIVRIDMIRYSNPKLFRIGLICLWIIAPIEMAIFKAGLWGFKKVKTKYSDKVRQEMK